VNGVAWAKGEGNIYEDMTINSTVGYGLPGATQAGDWPDGFTLYRNGSITGISNTPNEPVSITVTDGKQFLINNKYSGASANYFSARALSLQHTGPRLQKREDDRLCRVSRAAGAPAGRQCRNSGYVLECHAERLLDHASIQTNANLDPDSTLGRLVIGANTTGMTAGKHGEA